jgi:hypothetical protein
MHMLFASLQESSAFRCALRLVQPSGSPSDPAARPSVTIVEAVIGVVLADHALREAARR